MSTDVTAGQTLLSPRVAEEIRVAMVRRRMSGATLAKALDVSAAWVSYRLTGTQEIGLNDLQRIAAVLGESTVDLLRRAERGLTGDYPPAGDKTGNATKIPLPRSPYPGGRHPSGRSDSRHPPGREKRTSPTR